MQMYEQQLSRKELQDLRNKRTGLTLFQLSWIMVFVVLILAQFDIRGRAEIWPPPGVDKPGIVLPTIATVALLASSVLAPVLSLGFATLGLFALKDTSSSRVFVFTFVVTSVAGPRSASSRALTLETKSSGFSDCTISILPVLPMTTSVG